MRRSVVHGTSCDTRDELDVRTARPDARDARRARRIARPRRVRRHRSIEKLNAQLALRRLEEVAPNVRLIRLRRTDLLGSAGDALADDLENLFTLSPDQRQPRGTHDFRAETAFLLRSLMYCTSFTCVSRCNSGVYQR